ncbi:MAG TPA: hypothetical protein PKD54_08420 [Pirellulaceae bacterium]|nr:hypothetical protein [Pirellulaceae bacterium]
MWEPRRIAASAIPAALERALRYRLLNEPEEAESICRDILEVDERNRDARITLLLALTDQFDKQTSGCLDTALKMAAELDSPYEQEYYQGIVLERWGKAQLEHGLPPDFAMGWLRKAVHCFDRAAQLSQPNDPDAILRWNACVRVLQRFDRGQEQVESISHDVASGFGDDVPPR